MLESDDTVTKSIKGFRMSDIATLAAFRSSLSYSLSIYLSIYLCPPPSPYFSQIKFISSPERTANVSFIDTPGLEETTLQRVIIHLLLATSFRRA